MDRCFSFTTSLVAVILLTSPFIDDVQAEPEDGRISVSAGLGAHFDGRTDGMIAVKIHSRTSERLTVRLGYEAQCDSRWPCAFFGFYSAGIEVGSQIGRLRPYVLLDASAFIAGAHPVDDDDFGNYNVGLFGTVGLGATLKVTDGLSIYAEGGVISSTDRNYVAPRIAGGLRIGSKT